VFSRKEARPEGLADGFVIIGLLPIPPIPDPGKTLY
jgi:hypothetical protein